MENNELVKNDGLLISKKLLLAVYLIVPLLLLIVLVDLFYFDAALRPYMGVEALYLPIFIFVFNLPHVIASFFSFFDKEYVKHYRKHLFFYLPGLLLATAVLLYVDYVLGIVFFLLNDVWHGVKQKVGIALMLGAKPGWLHRVWTLAPFIASSIAFVYFIRPAAYPDFLVPYISPALFGGAVIILFSMVAMLWTSAKKVRLYIFAVSFLFLVNYFFILAGYFFFSLLAFRFVHDVSAFAFYVTHDYNRQKHTTQNWLYGFFARVPVPILVLTPLLGFSFAYMVRTLANGVSVGYAITILIAMTHYYLESVMWKRGSPHREHVRVRD